MDHNLIPSSEAYIQAATALQGAQEFKPALTFAKKAVKLDPKSVDGWIVLGLVQDDLGESGAAEKSLRKAYRLAPHNPEVLKTLGLFLKNKNQPQEGLEHLCEYIRTGKWTDQDILEVIAELGGETHEKIARETLELAWEKTLDHKIGYIFGLYVRDERGTEDAIRVFKMLTHYTDLHDYWNQFGISLYRQNRKDEAISAFEKAIDLLLPTLDEIDPESENSFEHDKPRQLKLSVYFANLASTLLDLNRAEQALHEINHSLVSGYDNLSVWKIKIQIFANLKRYEETVNLAKTVIKDFENKGDNLSDVYDLYLNGLINLNQTEEYKEVYKEAIQKYPQEPRFYDHAALFFTQEHLFNDAITAYGDIQKIGTDPNSKVRYAYRQYSLLVLNNQLEQAWEVVRPYVETSELIEGQANGMPVKGFEIEDLIMAWLFLQNTNDEGPGYDLLKQMVMQFIEHFPLDPGLRAVYAYLLREENDYKKMETQLREGLALKDPVYHLLFVNNLACTQLINNQVDEAYKAFSTNSQASLIDNKTPLDPMERPEFSAWTVLWLEDHYEFTPNFVHVSPSPLKLALDTNLAAYYLSKGDSDRAGMLAMQILVEDPGFNFIEPDLSLLMHYQRMGCLIMGSIVLARKEYFLAALYWRNAAHLDQGYFFTEWKILKKWIEDVEKHLSPEFISQLPDLPDHYKE